MTNGWRRLAAVLAIILVALVLVATVVSIFNDVPRLLVGAALLLVTLMAGWFALTGLGVRRVIGVVVGVAAVGAFVAFAIREEGTSRFGILVRVAAFLVAAALARFALGRDIRSLKATTKDGISVPAALHGVLLMNLRSGGGKAERFHLADECRQRGIEPIVLGRDDDLEQLARDAIARGADVIGMAGGDGSQAVVAGVAAETGSAMVVVPAGTRNHLALDLGLDRDDVVGALDAFGEAIERPMDLATVNDRVFVNNVSLGVYAAIIQSPEYRDDKVDTTLATIPRVLGPGSHSFDLHFAGPHGENHDTADVIQVSNNPYGTTPRGATSRPRLDTGRLGVVAVEIGGDRRAAAFVGAFASGHPERFEGFWSWTTDAFTVTSDVPIDVGIDGESMSMDSPLTFGIRPGSVRVRLPSHAIGASPAARALGWRAAGRGLWRTALHGSGKAQT